MVPTDFLPFLRANAVDGILPRWSDWWEEEDIASLYPDQETRSALTAEEPQLPLVYYEQTIPVPGGWDRRPCAYLWFGPPYDETAKRAGDRGWIVEHLGGAHLHMVIDPAAVADRIRALTETVLGDREDAWPALKSTRPTDQRSGAADPERRVYTAPTMQVGGRRLGWRAWWARRGLARRRSRGRHGAAVEAVCSPRREDGRGRAGAEHALADRGPSSGRGRPGRVS